jgi:hypothetical protein
MNPKISTANKRILKIIDSNLAEEKNIDSKVKIV